MSNAATLATRYARRPLLLEPTAAGEILKHIQAQDPRGLRTETRFSAALRKIGLAKPTPTAMDIEGDAHVVRGPTCYTPLWAQQQYGDPSDTGFAWSLYNGIALMEVDTAISERGEDFCGVWYHGYDTIQAGLAEALSDSRVNGVFLRLSSPGGVVAGGLYELGAFMRQARAQAGGKPIHVYADMACSAAYWIAAQADRIVSPRVGFVGSIGAVVIHEDISGALEKAGVVVTPIQFGASKTDGAAWKTLSAGALTDIQAEIDQCGADFIAEVAAGRPILTPEALIATQARVFMAQHDDPIRSGLALGFVDAVSTESDAFAALVKVSTPSQSAKSSKSEPLPMAKTPRARAMTPAAATIRAEAETKAGTTEDLELSEGLETCPTCDGSGVDDDEVCETCDGTGMVETDPSGDPDEQDRDAKAAKASAKNVADISASAEAKTHPHLAMAAIGSGQTLAQFQAAVGALANETKGGLNARMAGATRLGPDAKVEALKTAINPDAIYAARAKA